MPLPFLTFFCHTWQQNIGMSCMHHDSETSCRFLKFLSIFNQRITKRKGLSTETKEDVSDFLSLCRISLLFLRMLATTFQHLFHKILLLTFLNIENSLLSRHNASFNLNALKNLSLPYFIIDYFQQYELHCRAIRLAQLAKIQECG